MITNFKIFESKDDKQKSIDFQKYIGKFVAYEYLDHRDNKFKYLAGELHEIYFTDNFKENCWVIVIRKYPDSFFTEYSMKSIDIIDSYNTLEEAKKECEILTQSKKYNL